MVHFFRRHMISSKEFIRWMDRAIASELKNNDFKRELRMAKENTIAQFKYHFYEAPENERFGPKINSENSPIARPYFYSDYMAEALECHNQQDLYAVDRFLDEKGMHIYLNNGWIMDSTEDFTHPDSKVIINKDSFFIKKLNVHMNLLL